MRDFSNDFQLISNDKFNSSEHIVLVISARVLVACFCSTGYFSTSRIDGPIKKLVSESNPPKYRETTVAEYVPYFANKGLDVGLPLTTSGSNL